MTINNHARADKEIHETLNKFPGFWTLNTFALQTTFFVARERLFDKRRDSHSVDKLVELTIRNPPIFSKVCLLPQGDHRIGTRGAPRRNQTSERGNDDEDDRDGRRG